MDRSLDTLTRSVEGGEQMEGWWILLAALICPLVMGGMMVGMMRGMRRSSSEGDTTRESEDR